MWVLLLLLPVTPVSVVGISDTSSVATSNNLRSSRLYERDLTETSSFPDWLCSFLGNVGKGVCEEGQEENLANSTTATSPSLSLSEEEEEEEECPIVKPLSNETDVFDMENFTSKTWFVQKQQIDGFQSFPEEDFYCLTWTYTPFLDDGNENDDDDDDDDDFTIGSNESHYSNNHTRSNETTSIQQQQDARTYYEFIMSGTIGGVDGPEHIYDTGSSTELLEGWCAGQDEYGGGLLRISPCLLRPFLVKIGFPRWVIAVAKDYSWAIVSGGEINEMYHQEVEIIDGENDDFINVSRNSATNITNNSNRTTPLCTTRTNVSTEILVDTIGSGLWLLTRDPVASNGTIAENGGNIIGNGSLFRQARSRCSGGLRIHEYNIDTLELLNIIIKLER